MGVRAHLAAVWLSSIASCLATAQEPTRQERFAKTRAQLVADTKSQLQAEDLATVAWAAHAAAEYRLTECVAELRATLGARGRGADGHVEHTSAAVLDALVETEAHVPGEALVPFLSGWSHDPALLLLGRHAAENRTILLDQFRKSDPSSKAHLACGTWLADSGTATSCATCSQPRSGSKCS
jgi:hypothetical protein